MKTGKEEGEEAPAEGGAAAEAADDWEDAVDDWDNADVTVSREMGWGGGGWRSMALIPVLVGGILGSPLFLWGVSILDSPLFFWRGRCL